MRRQRIVMGIIVSVAILSMPFTGLGQETAQSEPQAAQPVELLENSDQVYPKIGLVLSGGGARGFAHIGVLKVLEEVGIPIDYVVGTSMGSIIGGLYAAGYSIDELENVTTEVNWDDVFSDTPPRQMWSFARKQASSKYLFGLGFTRKGFSLPQGITKGQKISTLFSFMTMPVSEIEHFDDFPIPYRAVAADIVTGEEVVLERGSLAEAMRASMSVPGVFTPVEVDGHFLVDGGIVNNLPVDVAQKMGADIIIAVDVSSELVGKEQLKNPLSILNQMVGLQMLKVTEAQRKLADVLIHTDLEDYSSTDFNDGLAISALGEKAARRQIGELQALAEKIRKTRPASRTVPHSIERKYEDNYIEDVVLIGDTGDSSVHKFFQYYKNEQVDPELIERTVSSIFSTGNYESVTFSLAPGSEEDGKILNLKLQKKSVNPHLLRFGMYYKFRQGSSEEDKMVLLVNATFNDLTGKGSFWSTDLEFVNVDKIRMQYFQPLFKATFISPELHNSTDYQVIYDDKDSVARYNIEEAGGSISVGSLIPRIGAVQVGYLLSEVTGKIVNSDSDVELTDFSASNELVSSITASLRIDSVDRFPFPHSGRLFDLSYEWASKDFGGDVDFQKLSAEYWRYFPFSEKQTVGIHLLAGSDLRTELKPYRDFILGGRNSFVGYKIEEIRGANIGIASLEYRYQIASLPSPIGSNIYATLIGNVGNAWRDLDELKEEVDLLYGGSIGVAADTFLGPVSADFSLGDGGRQVIYFNIGRKF
ncbi:hypothetical protein CSA56_09235 [candidate division KSB3 bacterium]|uniref:PNPLA domain-containing protein n=1 Tax=candidate division KSB3 bacterium TaxID=2044937 RepID=A0A2G6KEJ3_9BACT|nr:MAG: hypothetical protein CSA56_09235 [candidate division KSB3 bacterium]